MTRRLTPPSPIPRLKYALFDSYPNSASESATRIWMPNDAEKEDERARRQRVREEERRRENERRLEGQRREFERRCEALRRRKAAADEENDAALAKNGRDEVLGGACENRVGEGDKPQPHRDDAPWSNDQGRRSGKLKRRNRRATAKGETDAETKTPAGRAASPAPAKKEHPGLHVIAQVTPLAPPSPPITQCGESSSHSGKSETCRQGEDFRTSMGVDYLFDPPLRCTPLAPDASAPPPADEESAQTREAAADVLFFEPQLLYVDSTVAAIVPIVKIGRASAAFCRNSGESGNTRQPQNLFRGRGRGRDFGWYGRGGRAPRGQLDRTNWG